MPDYIRDLQRAKWGAATNLRRKNLELPMSALGQNRTSKRVEGMSALPPKADIAQHVKPRNLTPWRLGGWIRLRASGANGPTPGLFLSPLGGRRYRSRPTQ